eukprot:CAMPEP_0118964846 /NCGR_PEP_ID=MMETSP1173-20130426/2457_1 /TAXON_ID=1034831 /ORGANISM="Rhizochromulina marina cf, Strain CCMP1243" /LENGTH=49 /DNA_ID= /DNA_START= /DNA_END= /DNA_ORIENTATION=
MGRGARARNLGYPGWILVRCCAGRQTRALHNTAEGAAPKAASQRLAPPP